MFRIGFPMHVPAHFRRSIPRLNPDSPSDTALLIARSILLSANLAGHAPLLAHGEPEAVRHFLGERANRGWFAAAARHHWTRRWLIAIEGSLLGGIFAHYLARKRWIECEARRAIENRGIRQLVVLGAGYDSLGWRLCRDHPELRCFELDHPATQRLKHAASGNVVARSVGSRWKPSGEPGAACFKRWVAG